MMCQVTSVGWLKLLSLGAESRGMIALTICTLERAMLTVPILIMAGGALMLGGKMKSSTFCTLGGSGLTELCSVCERAAFFADHWRLPLSVFSNSAGIAKEGKSVNQLCKL